MAGGENPTQKTSVLKFSDRFQVTYMTATYR